MVEDRGAQRRPDALVNSDGSRCKKTKSGVHPVLPPP